MPGLPANSVLLAVGLAGIAVYFSVQTVRSLALVWRCVAMRDAALVVWPASGPRLRFVWLGLGILSASSMVVGGLTGAQWLHIYSQGIMAFFFLGVPHLIRTMRLGFYESGIWTETTFVPYGRIGRWAFAESPVIRLMLVPRGSGRALQLAIPRDEYGTVRKILQLKTREHVLSPEGAILDLEHS